ncbi:MAG: hypothetical protein B6244_03225 [Candidatus Cloacimonetes bacterium 4572_55]|nr:MAG: hypothetical protein B6244_03225 [Candidatus Cloacimonetes bacterium 4572_55]
MGLLAAGMVLTVLAGRAAAIFLVLFGIGMMMQIKRAHFQFRGDVIIPLIIRYSVLILGGLLFTTIWEADILHYIGFYGLFVIWTTKLNRKWLFLITITILISAEILRNFFDYTVGWQEGAVGLTYEDMWSITGYLRQMFFNGYHPIFPWLTFVTYGIILGKSELGEKKVQQRMISFGLATAVLGFAFKGMGIPVEFFPPHTLFIVLGMANATWVIGLSLYIVNAEKFKRVVNPIANMGRLALTHYLAHFFLGIVPVMIWTGERMRVSFELSFLIALFYIILTIFLGNIWLKHHLQGPMEWVLRKISKSTILNIRT